MAVKLNKGENSVIFKYETPGLKLGALTSFIAIIAKISSIEIEKHTKRKQN